MAVEQTKDGRWCIRYYSSTERDILGRKKRIREYFGRGESGEIAAKAREKELVTDKLNRLPEFQGPTFSALAQAYQTSKFVEVGAMSESDQVNTYYKIRRHIMPYFGDYRVLRFDSDLLDSYVSHRAGMWSDRKRTRKIKATTIHRELSIVKAILNWAAYIRKPPLIPFNPVDKYKMPKRDDEIIPPPTGAEIKKMYDAAAPHIKRAIVLSYNLGTRAGESELFRVCWEHVDMVKDIVTVISARKGGLTQRRVPIHEGLRPFLLQWRKEDADRYDCDPDILSGPIIRYKGKPIRRIKKAWYATMTRAGINRRIRPYDLRHAFATDLLEAGGDLKAVSEMLGHTRPDTTARIYQHASMNLRRDTIKKLSIPIQMDEPKDES